MTLALLFPGQGVQHPAMLPWLDSAPAARPALAELSDRFGADWRARCADDTWATANRVAQPLIVGLSLAAWSALRDHLPKPSLVAGYSVGELAAFATAGVFDVPTALRLADARAAAMDASAGDTPGGLCAVSGVSAATVEAGVAAFGVSIALRNAADRCVIGGPAEALDAAVAWLADRGAGTTRLRIGVASHTVAMVPAVEAFERVLRPIAFRRPNTLVVSGVTGRASRDPAPLKAQLAVQVARTVEWSRALETIAERGPRAVLEVGPGNSLSAMWNAAHPAIPARSADEFRHADAVVAWALRMSA